MVLGYFGFGHIIYVSLLFTNAIAILNEERFLAKSECTPSVLLRLCFGRPPLTYRLSCFLNRIPYLSLSCCFGPKIVLTNPHTIAPLAVPKHIFNENSRLVDPHSSERQRWFWQCTA